MKAVGLDTSVVLRLLIGRPKPQAERAWQSIMELRSVGGQVVVSDLVASETYFALQYHYGVPKAEALRQLDAFFDSSYVTASGCAAEVLATPGLATARPGFVARMIHAAYMRDVDSMLRLARGRTLSGRNVNLGGIHHATGHTRVRSYLDLDDHDRARVRALVDEGVRVSGRDLPGSLKVDLDDLLEE